MPIHRSLKNVVKNYSDAERKVREATSNDAWGPSSTLMAEIADMTHNVMAFTEIMQMIWKRLNDKNKNWRHVYKALVLLEYVIKTGSEKVAIQCRENVHTIETLKDFQFIEDNKDYGLNIRTKAKCLCTLLRDEEKLEEEIAKAVKAKQRLAENPSSSSVTANQNRVTFGRQASGNGLSLAARLTATSDTRYNALKSGGSLDRESPSCDIQAAHLRTSSLDHARPQTETEEQLQLQLALAISKEEHEKEKKKRNEETSTENVKISLAVEESKKEFSQQPSVVTSPSHLSAQSSKSSNSGKYSLFHLVDTSLSAAPASQADPWAALPGPSTSLDLQSSDCEQSLIKHNNANFALQSSSFEKSWLVRNDQQTGAFSESGSSSDPSHSSVSIWPNFTSPNVASDGCQLSEKFGEVVSDSKQNSTSDFLGQHEALVNLDRLVIQHGQNTNPFSTSNVYSPSNPFSTSFINASSMPVNVMPSNGSTGSISNNLIAHTTFAATSSANPYSNNLATHMSDTSATPLNPFL